MNRNIQFFINYTNFPIPIKIVGIYLYKCINVLYCIPKTMNLITYYVFKYLLYILKTLFYVTFVELIKNTSGPCIP